MQKFFQALKQKYPDHVVVDVKFTVDPSQAADQDVERLDADLALSVATAKEVDLLSLQA